MIYIKSELTKKYIVPTALEIGILPFFYQCLVPNGTILKMFSDIVMSR
jgi:hypothetical protein